jgi:hypothetical protein
MLKGICSFIKRHFFKESPETVYVFKRGSISFCVTAPGVGSIVDLTDEETNEMLKEVDTRMYIGRIFPDVTRHQFINTNTYADIRERTEEEKRQRRRPE